MRVMVDMNVIISAILKEGALPDIVQGYLISKPLDEEMALEYQETSTNDDCHSI